MNRIVTICLCLCFLTVAVPARGGPYDQELRQAQQLHKAGRLPDALRIYQQLLALQPGNRELLLRVQGIYQELKWYPQLIELLEGRLTQDPSDFDLRLDLGQAYFLSGQIDRARGVWIGALQMAPAEEGSYVRLSNAFLEHGMLPESEEILVHGRQALGDQVLFADRLAKIYELRAEYAEAAREYLAWVLQDPRRLDHVDAQLAQFPRDPTVDGAVGETLRQMTVAHPGQAVVRLLYGYHLMRTGKPEEAYKEFLILDEQGKGGGDVLLGFARRCAELGYHQVAIQACQEVVIRHPSAPVARQALLAVGDNLAAIGRYEQALSSYGQLVQRYPTSPEASQALFSRGEIFFGQLNDLDSALTTYRVVAAVADKNPRRTDAAFRVGDCLAAQGDLDGARVEYVRLTQGNFTTDIEEKAAYKLAELSFLEGKFEQAKESFDQLVADFPQGFFVNDALMQSMFLEEGLAAGQKALEAYVAALRLAQKRDYQPAMEAFGKAREAFASSALGDDIIMQIAFLREKTGHYQEALADLEQLVSEYPQSRLCPDALWRMGEIYELRLSDLPKAIQAYQQVLSAYPRYLFLDEVRRKLRQLEIQRTS